MNNDPTTMTKTQLLKELKKAKQAETQAEQKYNNLFDREDHAHSSARYLNYQWRYATDRVTKLKHLINQTQ